MKLAIVMLIAYIPFFYWIIVQTIEDCKPQKRVYDETKINDYWIR
jgi:hypothetical protein